MKHLHYRLRCRRRAATPTAAAELLSPDRQPTIRQIEQPRKKNNWFPVAASRFSKGQQSSNFMISAFAHPKKENGICANNKTAT